MDEIRKTLDKIEVIHEKGKGQEMTPEDFVATRYADGMKKMAGAFLNKTDEDQSIEQQSDNERQKKEELGF